MDFNAAPSGDLKTLRFIGRKKFSKSGQMFFPSKDSLEQATPEPIALYRAERLKCNNAIDLCCGIGMDSIALSKFCKKVLAFDIDGKIIECARKNAEVFGSKNIEFSNGSALSVDLGKLNPDIVFADPSRRIKGQRVSSLSDTMPKTDLLVKKISECGVKNFCIEVSRELPLEQIAFDCEKEFVSLNGELNCISLYFGGLKKCCKSVVILPQNARLESNSEGVFSSTWALKKFLMELDESVVKARMQSELLEQCHGAEIFSKNFFASETEISNPFFKNVFEVLESCKVNFSEILRFLQKLDAKSVVLRGCIPAEMQFKIQNEFAEKLSGSRKLHVFLFEGSAAICRNTAFKG